jgi:hypoxanthine phosphoribosyltransferase
MPEEREILTWDLFGEASRTLAQMVADDVADTGHTLRSVELFCEGKVGDVRTCVIYEKPHSVVKCDYVWRRTNLWINFPWSDKPPVAKRDWSVADA